MKWLFILFMTASLQLHGQTPVKDARPVILVGNVALNGTEGTIVDGKIVTSKQYQGGGQSLQAPVQYWVSGVPGARAVNEKVEFLVLKTGTSERTNAAGTKVTMEEFKFIRLVTKDTDPGKILADRQKQGGWAYPK